MLRRPADEPGLIVNTIAWAYGAYLGNVLYDTAKAATARMAFGMAHELQPYAGAAVALALGHLGRERIAALRRESHRRARTRPRPPRQNRPDPHRRRSGHANTASPTSMARNRSPIALD